MYFSCRRASNRKGEETLRDSHCCAAERRPRNLSLDFCRSIVPWFVASTCSHDPRVAHKLTCISSTRKGGSIYQTHSQLQLFRGADYFPVPSFLSLPAGEMPTKPNERNISKTKNLETLPSAAPWSSVLPTCLDLWICARIRPRQGYLTSGLYPLNEMILNVCKNTF